MVTELHSQEDLDRLLEKSNSSPVLIFKHSTQCSISAAADEEVTKFAETASQVEIGIVLVIENRPLSDSVAKQLDIYHQSPQLILVKDKHSIWKVSHWSITADAIAAAIKS